MSIVDIPDWVGVRRPQRADARRNFDALLAAARAAFAERGLQASLEDIARDAGVGIGTLYRNFASRDALAEAVYVQEVESLIAAAQATHDQEPWAAFATFLDRYVEYVGTKRALLEGLNRGSPALLACKGAMMQAGAPVLERAQAAGVVRDDIVVEDVLRMISGITSVQFPDAAQRDKVLGIAIDGLRVR
ncbi:regulatory TetR family protein [Diaminobutyricimonas aerilata]|uniref:Regulatory TetR family protein n=1 Tax=Diaminobutyricimonas aerilata TaxID=1162967 RepID=A0A2M9CFJ3_9MICO|nr:TetR/AcrR family transcriptional regulator [Diaminobutyricimonas aerilata]PJJ70714.1 regulatory TetR family protein [Diaminobutyricimonas aerilata]